LRYVEHWHSTEEINQTEIDAEKAGVGLAGKSNGTAGYTTAAIEETRRGLP
jgi:hypothetical protein